MVVIQYSTFDVDCKSVIHLMVAEFCVISATERPLIMGAGIAVFGTIVGVGVGLEEVVVVGQFTALYLALSR